MRDVFVVERFYDNGLGAVLGAFPTLEAAQLFSAKTIVTRHTPHEIEITRCAPTPLETWRRFADAGRWTSLAWEHRSVSSEGR